MGNVTTILALATAMLIYGGTFYGIYRVIKHLIRYHAETQAYTWDRYTRAREAERDLNDLEDELNYMKDHDWSKEP